MKFIQPQASGMRSLPKRALSFKCRKEKKHPLPAAAGVAKTGVLCCDATFVCDRATRYHVSANCTAEGGRRREYSKTSPIGLQLIRMLDNPDQNMKEKNI
jgi:hypothetical protein